MAQDPEVKDQEKIVAILGTGDVGIALSKGFLHLKYKVIMGTRNERDKKNEEIVTKVCGREKLDFHVESFQDAAKKATFAVLCVKWEAVGPVLEQVKDHLKNKILIDAVNPLLMQPVFGLDDKIAEGSAGAHIQKLLPDAKVVKALNSIGNKWMCDANPNGNTFASTPTMFIAGNDDDAKAFVKGILQKWNWDVIDAGKIEKSRYLESLAMLWIDHLFATKYNPDFAFSVVRVKK